MFVQRRVELVEASPEFEWAFLASANRRKMSEAAVDEIRARLAELRAKSALALACWNQRPDIARLLIEEGADPNLKTNSNFTALHYAAEKGSTELVELLINAGADVNALNEAQRSPLHLAADQGNAEIVELLINYGADKEQVSRPGRTPLIEATANRKTGSFAAMRKLLEAGADPNHSATKGNPPLHYAMVISSDRVKLLLDFGADPNISCGSDSNQTPIFHALDIDVAKALLAAGARLDLKDTRGRTPIEHHKYAARDHVAKFLVNHQCQAT
jgi:ankyrin repeat protein